MRCHHSASRGLPRASLPLQYGLPEVDESRVWAAPFLSLFNQGPILELITTELQRTREYGAPVVASRVRQEVVYSCLLLDVPGLLFVTQYALPRDLSLIGDSG